MNTLVCMQVHSLCDGYHPFLTLFSVGLSHSSQAHCTYKGLSRLVIILTMYVARVMKIYDLVQLCGYIIVLDIVVVIIVSCSPYKNNYMKIWDMN